MFRDNHLILNGMISIKIYTWIIINIKNITTLAI
jgi:hypothetical protein